MAKLTKAQREERAERREKQWDERQATRLRFGLGFAGAYVAEKLAVNLLPSLTPAPDSPLNAVGGIVDAGLAAGGTYFAVTDKGEVGDYATGAAVVGGTQFLDRLVGVLQGLLNRNAA